MPNSRGSGPLEPGKGGLDASVIAQTLDQLYVEAPGTHPFVARMQPVNPVDLVEHVLHEAEKQTAPTAFLGDLQHPDWADYVATNLLDALGQVPDTGDWHGALRSWCEQHQTGKIKPNRAPA